MGGDLQFRHVAGEHGRRRRDGGGDDAPRCAELYDGLDIEAPDMPKAGAAELGPPGGTFLVGYRDGRPVCGGGIKRLPDGACEIKRMYVVPDERGKGPGQGAARTRWKAPPAALATRSPGSTPATGSRTLRAFYEASGYRTESATSTTIRPRRSTARSG